MQLKEYMPLATSGARGVISFNIDSDVFLAIPQLAEDIPDTPANMNGGNSNVSAIIYKWVDAKFVEFQQLAAPGGEHIAFHNFAGRDFLAVASIRSGSNPDFNAKINSTVYEWDGTKFTELQQIPTFAAKDSTFFEISGELYLGFAEGFMESPDDTSADTSSHLYRFNGSEFVALQALPTKWGYCLQHFTIGPKHFLAVADHLQASSIYQLQDGGFVYLQEINCDPGGRDIMPFEVAGEYYLAYANLTHNSYIYRWNGSAFVQHQELQNDGGRSFAQLEHAGELYVFLTNFITGTRDAPQTVHNAIVYKWQNGELSKVMHYQTSGGTASCPFVIDGQNYLAVSNSLSADIRFRVDGMVYTVNFSRDA